MSFVGVAAGIGAAGGIFKIGQGIHQNNLAKRVKVPDATYETSPYAQRMLEEASRLNNSVQPGYQNSVRNIYGNQSNALGSVERNATSGAQALALDASIQGNTNNAFNGLNQEQNQWTQGMLNNWNNANQGMISEGDKVFQDRVRKQQMAIAEKNALRGAGTQNLGGGINDLANNAFAWAQMNAGKKTG